MSRSKRTGSTQKVGSGSRHISGKSPNTPVIDGRRRNNHATDVEKAELRRWLKQFNAHNKLVAAAVQAELALTCKLGSGREQLDNGCQCSPCSTRRQLCAALTESMES